MLNENLRRRVLTVVNRSRPAVRFSAHFARLACRAAGLALWLMLLAAAPVRAQPAAPQQVGSLGDLWLDISMGPPLTAWFNQVARATDIARIDNAEQIPLLDQVTTGRKMVVFKSVAEAGARLPFIARGIDVVGYNLEQGPANPASEQADPVGSVQRMQTLARQYNLQLALGPDRDFALEYGPAMAPYVDIFVLQIQRVQTEPETARDFVLPLVAQLRAANPALLISVQVRTEGNVSELVALLESLKEDLDGVSILTSAGTVGTAETLVQEIRTRATVVEPVVRQDEPAAPVVAPAAGPALSDDMARVWVLTLVVAVAAGAILGGLITYLLMDARR